MGGVLEMGGATMVSACSPHMGTRVTALAVRAANSIVKSARAAKSRTNVQYAASRRLGRGLGSIVTSVRSILER